MMILGFLFLLLAVWYWMRNRDRKGGKISALLLAVVGVTIIGFTHADNVEKQRAAESSSIASSKKAKSESISESKSESRDQAMDDATYTRLQKTAILYHRAAQIKLLSIVTKRKRKLQKRQYHRPLRPVRTGNRVLRLPKLPIKLLLQA